ncbi:MAG: 16S rRNA (guanine(966)-N(2))-methyltransferase RsmD [Gammaproteobacteria bacterium]|nr:16S rRNA (guanine(966)-N(2))-methyltransferase RsmD [Gammaproteobacteria bacterium]
MAKRPPGKLRIIGGQHRSRVIEFDPDSGVRPTPDRVRQTVFDWLTPAIDGARCLDLFAGSGALGLEAISRGASKVTFVEYSRRQVELIRANLATLREDARADLVPTDGITYLELSPGLFDVVFLDPPFGSPLLPRALELLPQRLAPGNRVYLEWPARAKPSLPPGFTLLREKQAGQVSYGLATYAESAAEKTK